MSFLPTVPPPLATPLAAILPSEPLLLMGAGPVPIPHAVASANGVVINHLGDTMNQVVLGLKDMAAYAFQTSSSRVLGVAGPASASMEMAIANLAWPGRRVLALVCGTFSHRLAEMAAGVGADVTTVTSGALEPIRPEQVEQALAQGQFDLVTVVQGETSCGVRTGELEAIARLVRAHGALLIVDAVCTLSTTALQMDAWGIDVCVTGGQKGLSSIPGVSLIAFSEAAWEVVERRPRPMPHWCLDAARAWRFWGEHAYHYTAPVPGILALYEALRLIAEETLEARFERHARSSAALQSALQVMGLELLVPEQDRLHSVVAVCMPEGADIPAIRRTMVEGFNVEIAGAFGLDIVRIGQMGEQCRPSNLFRVLYALGASCRLHGLPLDVAGGMAQLERELTVFPPGSSPRTDLGIAPLLDLGANPLPA